MTKYKAQADGNLQNFVHSLGKARRKVATEMSQESETAVKRSLAQGQCRANSATDQPHDYIP